METVTKRKYQSIVSCLYIHQREIFADDQIKELKSVITTLSVFIEYMLMLYAPGNITDRHLQDLKLTSQVTSESYFLNNQHSNSIAFLLGGIILNYS